MGEVLQYLRERAKAGAVKLPHTYDGPTAHWLKKVSAGDGHPCELHSPARVDFEPYVALLSADRTLVRAL